eukprot:6187241-Pleurochrysis_carterae.AAC.1
MEREGTGKKEGKGENGKDGEKTNGERGSAALFCVQHAANLAKATMPIAHIAASSAMKARFRQSCVTCSASSVLKYQTRAAPLWLALVPSSCISTA